MKIGKKVKCLNNNRINWEITSKQVRLIDINGDQFGIISLNDAIKKARDLGVDLIEVSSNINPPICRIMDYGKFLYERTKTFKKQRKNQKITHIKEIKFRPNTDEGDFKIKLRNVTRFLENGDKVKVTVRFRGRELVHSQIGVDMLNRIRDNLIKLSNVELYSNKIEGRQIVMILSPRR